MRWFAQLPCVLLMTIGAVSASLAQDSPVRSDQEILVELEQNWNEAFYRKDVDFIASILSEDFVATYDDGRQGDKATELDLVEAFDQQVESSIQDEFLVQVYGDTALVWFRLNLVGIRNGERTEVKFRFTDVFVWEDDGWKCVSSQSTRIESV